MLKKIILLLFSAFIMLSINTVSALAADFTIDKSNIENGVISIEGSLGEKNIAVRITKDKQYYTYFLSATNKNVFPLQMGNGKYKIQILENTAGTKYRVLLNEDITANNITEDSLYTSAIQLIDFNKDMSSIKAMNTLTSADAKEEDKLKVFYNHIVDNISYDYDKAKNIASSPNYLPVIDTIYKNKKGICYDYSSLFAAILRQHHIPTRLQMGYTKAIPEYHAWNEVLLDGKWYKIDTTYDAQAKAAKASFTMQKSDDIFSVVKQY